MAKATCIEPGCDNKPNGVYYTSGYCCYHASVPICLGCCRRLTKGALGHQRAWCENCDTCIMGCGRRRYGRKLLCSMHIRRLARSGELEPPVKSERSCAVSGCDHRYYAVGLCSMHWKRQWKHGTTADERFTECQRCGAPVSQGGACQTRLYCADTCAVETRREQAAQWCRTLEGRMARAAVENRRRAAYAEPYDRLGIFERDGWACQLCGGSIDSATLWPDALTASIDHIVPISKGGHDTESNVQAAHLICNVRKGNRENASTAVLSA